MKKKISILISIYYSVFILSSCCDDEHFWIFFDDVTTSYNNGYDVEFTVRPKNEVVKEADEFVGESLLASFKRMNSLQAFSPGCDETFTFEKYIVGFKVTSNLSFKDSLLPGESLNDLFLFNAATKEELMYDSQLAIFRVILKDTTWTERNLYFEYEFNNGDLIKDTLENVILKPTTPSP